MLVILPVLLYLTAQIGAVVRLRGWPRRIALLPVIPMAWVTYVTIQAFRNDSNLWPIILILASPVAAFFIFVVWAFARKSSTSSELPIHPT